MGLSISLEGLNQALGDAEGQIATIATDAMRGATDTLKEELRDQIRDAGLGGRLANTWRAETYPSSGASLDPAGFAWSNAPDIITAFTTGATIAPLGGKNFLWIPTKNVPPQGGRRSSKRMTPEQVLASFRVSEFVIKKGRADRLLAYIVEGRGKTARGATRRVRKGRLGHGDSGELVLMFTLTASVTDPKMLDPQGAANTAAADYVDRIEEALR